jgi:DNA-binding response OmpR family regulator
MNNIHLKIIGSQAFTNLLTELDHAFNLNEKLQDNNRDILIKVLFVDNLDVKKIKKILLENLPIVLFSKQKDYVKKNSLILLDFHISLQVPIEILSFKEILNILVSKYNFFKNSKIIINDYEIDSNSRTILKRNIKAKLTEKELELILALNKENGLDKSFLLRNIWKHSINLDTHAFETHLHRLRKKIFKYYKDKNFIIEKNSLYYLVN